MPWRWRCSEHGSRNRLAGAVDMVTIRYYGWIAERLGRRQDEINYTGPLRDLLRLVGEDIELNVRERKVFVALNHNSIKDLDVDIGEDDIVAIFPAFSGG